MLRIKTFSFLLSALFFLLFLQINFAQADSTPSPILVGINKVGQSDHKIIITGLTWPNTNVSVYLNGNQAGEAIVNQTDTGADNFYWQLNEVLSPGEYQITAIAQDNVSLQSSGVSNALKLIIGTPAAPTLIEPNEDYITSNPRPYLTGLTENDTVVHFWVDGVYNGKTERLSHPSGTANFAYRPFLNLGIGEHRAWAVAEDQAGQKSQRSNELVFRIEPPLPAPILLPAVVNASSSPEQPYIVGLVKNDYRVKVFIDHHLNGTIKVNNHESGVANFAYQPYLPLPAGSHLIYLTAIDERGKESPWSSLASIVVPRQPRISEEAAAEELDTIVKGTEAEFVPIDIGNNDEAAPTTGDSSGAIGNDNQLDTDVSEFIATSVKEETEKTGLLNESQERQGKLRFNLIIFILFLLAVIVWIFWVNRELIKEKREQEEDGKNQDKLEF